jgi:hypothetical protein
MKNLRIATGLAAVCIFVGGILGAAAQDAKPTHEKTRTLTGCLQKGDDANEFHLAAKDGGKWDLKSDNVKLADHVGHTVKVVGVVDNATAHGMKEDVKTGVDKKAAETGNITVTDLSMVSDSCK